MEKADLGVCFLIRPLCMDMRSVPKELLIGLSFCILMELEKTQYIFVLTKAHQGNTKVLVFIYHMMLDNNMS